MSLDPQKITLGQREFTIRPLSVAQVQKIEPVVLAASLSTMTVSAAIDVLKIGLSRDFPDIVVEDIEGSVPELATAMMTILQLGGFNQGEARAAAPSASNGTVSTAA